MSRRVGSWPSLLVALAAIAALLLGPSLSARAHAELVETNPSNGTLIAESPSRMELRFSEPVVLIGAEMRSGDTEVAVAASLDGSTLVVEPAGLIPDGTAVLEWQVASEDGHTIGGTLVFHVRMATSGEVVEAEAATAGDVMIVANSLTYVGLLLGGGLALFAVHVHDGGTERATLRRFAVGLLAMGLVGTLGNAAWRAADTGFSFSTLPGGTAPAVTTAVFGVALVLAGYGRVVPVTVGVGIALLAPVFTGHTRSFSPTWLVVGTDVLHLYAGAVWGGGLAAISLISRRGRSEMGAIVRRFSRIAGWSLAAVLVSGATLAWTLHGSWESLVGTDHGRLVLAKLTIVLGVAATGAFNRYRVIPSIARAGARARRTLSATTAAEAAGLVLVLVVTGALVDMDPTRATGQEVGSQGPVQTAIGDHLLIIELTPGGPGANQAVMSIRTPDGEPADLIGPVTVVVVTEDRANFDALPGEDGYEATIDIPGSGDWGIEVRARVGAEAVASLVLDTTTGRLAPTSGLMVAGAVMPAPPGGSGSAAVYMTVTSARDDQLVEASSPACGETSLHETVISSDGTASMHHRHAIELMAGAPVRLAAGGLHVMCETAQVEVGDMVPFRVVTASGEQLDFLVPVVNIAETLD